jgi:flavin reductase (DIM6/NTAB) family NADH-FMN oxidoreductase RutF
MTLNLDLDGLSARDRYKLLTAVVIPRPIAWVTTVNAEGLVNAAPFSFFNVFGQDPALVILGLERRADGSPKDTERNIDATGEFVVNIPVAADVEAMVGTAAAYPSDQSETEALGLDLAPSAKVAPPRLAKAAVAIECERMMALSLSAERSIMLGRAVGLATRDGLIDPETLYVDWNGDYPIARLFGDRYGRIEDMERHTIPQPKKT